ncbi:type VI secretion system baseplate subunit TssE [Ancylobacter sp. 6x-1]|uniref:Type VI secretion system baseplate subunit TssE n=1 Tax=Ancylobacter crimeensis TaxID=2579147 RepID=A0ABT0D7K4_9HYPH|nr:type VI secretion system baseplate subunit TssE [Ancylobacter crimeensis]MCK0195928.1 type VI secretion system baseplate subunit TssE [Ancylobacter crimeensis]
MKNSRNLSLTMPFMHAFRAASEARDARLALDLRDTSGERVIAGRRTAARGAVNEQVLMSEILRDLETLLNTVQMGSTQNLEGCDEVARSILNFGLPDLVHRTVEEDAISEIVGEIETAIRRYEPRVRARTLDVRRDTTLDAEDMKIRFLLSAEIVLDERNIPVEFVADIATDSGKITVIPT